MTTTNTIDLDDEYEAPKVCIHPLATRPVLYTDTVGGVQTCRDDLWAVTTDELNALAGQAAPVAPTLPKSNDGQEQEAFEAWAHGERYDMTTHPLHWLFLNERTYAARQGWKAALEYVGNVMAAAPATQQADAPDPRMVALDTANAQVRDAASRREERAERLGITAATTASASREATPLTRCAAGRDGDCNHPQCPQARDGEPHKSQRHCPLDTLEDDE
jgi:hypothetical protein